jgi:hypothetical protein
MQTHRSHRQDRTQGVQVFEPASLRPILAPALERLVHGAPQALVDMTR